MINYNLIDKNIINEFYSNPIGRHSLLLQSVLNVMRGKHKTGRYVLFTLKPHKKWALAFQPMRRGSKIEIYYEITFDSVLEAERYVFNRRIRELKALPRQVIS